MDTDIAIKLLEFISVCPDLPITKELFLIDDLSKDKCMSLRMHEGTVLQQDIDGYKQIQYPFMLLYKDTSAKSPEDRSEMMAVLNKIGAWMEAQALPKFPNMTWEQISQTAYSSASIMEKEENTYIAGYTLILSNLSN